MKITKQIKIRDVLVGGGAPIAVQSMTNTDTRDAKATLAQIRALADAGCDIVRCAVPDMQAAEALGMNPITIFAGQNAGASLGNLICPNNTVAACATVDAVGQENKVMKRTLPAFAIILVIYMVLTMLYTCVLFPNFGA